MSRPARVVVLVSGEGSNLQAILDASVDPVYGVEVVAVGADRDGIHGLKRAEAADVPTFVVKVPDYADRPAWNAALTEAVASYEPDLIVCAGFMKVLGPDLLARFPDRIVNSHPALLPAFPGAHAVSEALAYGVKFTGVTVHLVDAGVDTGPILAQAAVPVLEGDDEGSLHERIKAVERPLFVQVVGELGRAGAGLRLSRLAT